MSLVLIKDTPQVSVGLVTYTYTIPSAEIYTVRLQSTEIPPSGISILVKQNGSTVYTAPTLSPTQSAIQFNYSQLYAANDVVTVALSSSSANDLLLNSVKTSVSIGQGE